MNIIALIATDPNVAPAFRRVLDMSPELLAYEHALRCHDWSHEYSDDPAVWRKGRAELAALREQQTRLDPDFAVWNRHCPLACMNGRSYR